MKQQAAEHSRVSNVLHFRSEVDRLAAMRCQCQTCSEDQRPCDVEPYRAPEQDPA